ncbi:MAG: N4-gp56 family major capsid protein [Clostridia bacterium]|nr:N4-gp56 family major capsid protein [Clostridia bacterium]
MKNDFIKLRFDLQLFAGEVVPGNAAGNMMTSGSSELDPEFGKINDEQFLRMHESQLIFTKFGAKTLIPDNSGTTARYFIKDHIDPVKDPLTEGMTPQPNKFTIRAKTADIEQYGDWIMFTDVATKTSIHNLMVQVRQPQSYQSAKTRNLLIRDELMAGALAAYASKTSAPDVEIESAANLTAECKLTVKEVQKMANRLRRNDIAPAEGGDYIMIVHPDVLFDLKQDPAWKDWNSPQNAVKFEKGEVGRVDGVRFVESTIAGITKEEGEAGGLAVYHNLIFGAEAYATLDMENGGTKVIVKTLGSAGTADPLDQRCSVGWKLWNGAAVLDELAIYDLMCCSYMSAKAAAN